ncbi:uncharacterized protein KNAG_0C03750 [Huiozyma naganishii CBS 8797]|uniref:Uncharacterized protein n=1 Tax=Huiozyma naganishii (strain ATCC MYA-139 / BCRC 22969 / CBS 8797 / KCTC 17520 / NBRC 10181 / NCYC 3082 / Yp74L-3) TaxID=1071383 RepID=J7S4V6_HUIN7|nr:hypothetical protein KNAG_0C03750 [Kazachstania naganishii CBS 8797]CCK69479.1 hypothetical protein KNAG_0C03750 [Kazachstania naganishii CBS 8797]
MLLSRVLTLGKHAPYESFHTEIVRYTFHRTIMGYVRNAFGLEPRDSPDTPQISNRFHPWEESPCADLRDRAARIKTLARCPVTGKNINYTCPISGIPTHHSRKAWEDDTDYHKNKTYEKLKKVNIYEHDLRSGRSFPEFDFPAEQGRDRAVNLQNWDLFLYTRQFYSMDTEFHLATVTKMLSYPITIASVLHEFSPYKLQPRGPVTLEGLKSIAALRYTLYPKLGKTSLSNNSPMRIFIVGTRAESQLPGHVWKQLQYLFSERIFEIHFIGPECQLKEPKNTSTPLIKKVDDTLSLIYHPQYFHELHKSGDLFPYNPYKDVFFIFHPGFAYPDTRKLWLDETIPNLLETKCAIFHTGFNEGDITNDVTLIDKCYRNEIDVLMKPIKNVFGSVKWELNDINPQEVYQFNMYIAGFRGKRYHPIKI